MAWTTPPTAVTGAVITASFWNVGGRDNLIDLDRRTTAAVAAVDTLQTTTSLTFTDLATVGPAATATVGANGKVLVAMWCRQFNSVTPQVSLMGVALSGANTVAATDELALTFTSPSNNGDIRHGGTYVLASLNSGLTTGTCKYRVTNNTGSFETRRLSLTALSA